MSNLRIADARIIADVVGGNTHAASIMTGEKAREMIAHDHTTSLEEEEFVGGTA